MMFIQAGIAAVGQDFDCRMNVDIAFFEEPEVVSLPIRKVGADNLG